ncbi:AlbA family DNA-binding domain-containing protein [Rhodococcus sp. AQ5-07]|uniref:AlbA family DNA-binding domain-containing protein n=1 Tax=Rhodococcus sp. AQ5-07 TaxID=2054902 RepID=UPI0013B3C178|nr:ATP-binding protein [Rhodococcus sp. AQ5-07]
MTLNIATDRAFRSDDELEQLVRAVLAANKNDESRWLEWKSSHDLTTSEALFAIAKAVLGFANRTIIDANKTCEGTAYLVVGAEHDHGLIGVAATDGALLGQKLKTYIGGAVRWTLAFVEIDGKAVLVVTVDAPRPGDSMHTLRKNYEKFHAGTIFVRRAGRTEYAGPEDIRLLEERLLAGQRTLEISDIVVRPQCPEPLFIIDDSPKKIAQWVEARRASIEQTVPDPTPFQSAMNRDTGVWDRKRRNFDSQVDKYMTDVERILPFAARQALVESSGNKLRVMVQNTSGHALSSVLMRLSFPSDLVEVFDGHVGGEYSLPSPPVWQNIDFAPHFPDPLAKFEALQNLQFHLSCEDSRLILEWRVGNLQADHRLTSPAFTVLPQSIETQSLTVEWALSSSDREGRQTGTFDLDVDQNNYMPLAIAESLDSAFTPLLPAMTGPLS